MTALPWSPDSWRSRPIEQPVDWPDPEAAAKVCKHLAELPPLIFAGEARSLTSELAEAASGRAFVLQGGDCAESFEGVSADRVRDQIKLLLQMALLLTYSTGTPVVKIGRIAGQYAKPRTDLTEEIEGAHIPSFRGHILNSEIGTERERVLDPERMIRAYNTSTATHNLLRAFTSGGFASLTRVHEWNQRFLKSSAVGQRYEAVASQIDRAIRFLGACGLDTSGPPFDQAAVWTSHEALLLDYEQALTRVDSLTSLAYGCSAHMLWIGERTRQIGGAHIEYARGIQNPLGVKVGPDASPGEVVALCEILNPERAPGRLTLITRMGAQRVEKCLLPIIDAVTAAEHPVVWVCDPMHGNTIVSGSGVKTRRFEDVFAEILGFFRVHQRLRTWPGGIHLEMTAEDVTECTGGSEALDDSHLSLRYDSLCDPRLNGRQSLELMFDLSELIAEATSTYDRPY
ncbi:MAG: class II 3-deoxy-7-phosphoheptulonate synthase [Acidimicrobiales bacterium]